MAMGFWGISTGDALINDAFIYIIYIHEEIYFKQKNE